MDLGIESGQTFLIEPYRLWRCRRPIRLLRLGGTHTEQNKEDRLFDHGSSVYVGEGAKFSYRHK